MYDHICTYDHIYMYIYGHYLCIVYNILYVHIILYYNIYICGLRTIHSHRVLLTTVLRMFMNYIKGTCSVTNLMQPSTQLQCIIRYCLAECMLSNSCNMGARDLPDMYARSPRATGPRAYISGKSRASMLQVLCITSGTLKICLTYRFCFAYLYNNEYSF